MKNIHEKMEKIYSCTYKSPVGMLKIDADETGICAVNLEKATDESDALTLLTQSFAAGKSESVAGHTEKVPQPAARYLRQVVADNIEKAQLSATRHLRQAVTELDEYFVGARKQFDVPLSLHGTEFQMKVWEQLRQIPYGETASYSEIAVRAGSPKACRAVGMANNRNPIMIIVPCHRVIGKSGALVGYAGGLDVKAKLLEMERR